MRHVTHTPVAEDTGAATSPPPPGAADDRAEGGSSPDAPERDAPAAAPAAPERKQRSALVLARQVGGVVTTIATLVGLVFLFAPGLKPEPPAAAKGASFGDITVDTNVSRADYLRRLDRGLGGYARAELRRVGVVLGYHVTITGHKGQHLTFRWGVYSATNGKQVYREKVTTVTPEAATDEASSQLWTPLPRGRGPYYVLLQLFEEDGLVVIDQARSGVFPGLAGRANRSL